MPKITLTFSGDTPSNLPTQLVIEMDSTPTVKQIALEILQCLEPYKLSNFLGITIPGQPECHFPNIAHSHDSIDLDKIDTIAVRLSSILCSDEDLPVLPPDYKIKCHQENVITKKIIAAIEKDDHKTVAAYLHKYPELITWKSSHTGFNLLFIALELDAWETLRYLLTLKNTPWHEQDIRTGKSLCIRYLEKKHAKGRLPLSIEEVVAPGINEYHADHHTGNPAIHWAIYLGDEEALDTILKHGVSLYHTNDEGWYPFGLARWLGNKSLIAIIQRHAALRPNGLIDLPKYIKILSIASSNNPARPFSGYITDGGRSEGPFSGYKTDDFSYPKNLIDTVGHKHKPALPGDGPSSLYYPTSDVPIPKHAPTNPLLSLRQFDSRNMAPGAQLRESKISSSDEPIILTSPLKRKSPASTSPSPSSLSVGTGSAADLRKIWRVLKKINKKALQFIEVLEKNHLAQFQFWVKYCTPQLKQIQFSSLGNATLLSLAAHCHAYRILRLMKDDVSVRKRLESTLLSSALTAPPRYNPNPNRLAKTVIAILEIEPDVYGVDAHGNSILATALTNPAMRANAIEVILKKDQQGILVKLRNANGETLLEQAIAIKATGQNVVGEIDKIISVITKYEQRLREIKTPVGTRDSAMDYNHTPAEPATAFIPTGILPEKKLESIENVTTEIKATVSPTYTPTSFAFFPGVPQEIKTSENKTTSPKKPTAEPIPSTEGRDETARIR